MAAESGKIDPMHQFEVQSITDLFTVGGQQIAFTNSALWMVITLGVLWAFMMGGMRRQLVPGRWQAAVEGVTGFIENMMVTNIGPQGRKFVPYVFSLFMFILFANILGLLPLGVVGVHPFTVTSHLTITGVLAIVSFGIVLAVGFAKHGLHFFSLFVPHGAPWWMLPILIPVEFVSFMVRPFSLALRLFVAMTAGHILLKVLAGFVINGMNADAAWVAPIVSLPSFILMIGISALELLVAAIQAYVFALLTSLYLNDAVNLH
ncbi:MAG: ATP synthase F0 sector subunit a [uncultured Sphingosinicella sp.]|uniref:ATP synthase subunit a n=1 Tax=uncultured Sphingosinicella sp. TaxID=478748 RepID=A0A6J4U0R0_9SPHN|nr:F0F1 ATP synthase subunit A [uncultured Sphingosinicella sp.]CAA9537205.1 MAG: ATP synthase F0 sector subunit a [uncultured Sphingosinicella sp.]